MSSTSLKPIWHNIVFLIGTPILALTLCPWYISMHGIEVSTIAVSTLLWFVAGMGITVGYHRLFSHRSFKANRFIRFIALIAGATAIQNSALTWSSDHRKHHRNVDHSIEDPYSISNGFLWAHIGWIFFNTDRDKELNNVSDLLNDPLVKWQHRNYLAITTVTNIAFPLLFGILFGNIMEMLLFAGLARIVMAHHFTFCINSLAHIWGTQPWSSTNSSKDNWMVSLFTFGEGYHNYHHSFEVDYRNGPLWYNYDPSKWLIWLLSKIGVVSDLRRMPAERIFRRRFQERKALYPTMDQFNIWLNSAEEQQRELLIYLKTQLEQTESALEEKLSDLRKTQRKWTEARRSQLNPEKWRAQFRKSQDSAKRTLKEWEQLLEAYVAEMEALSPQLLIS
jgi:stearoyl-CoA desaturase (Delta-9 desaturase)